MIDRAQGTDILSLEKVQQLADAVSNIEWWRLRLFFNTRDGCLLRRFFRGHRIVRTQRTYCGLCGHNIKGALRSMTNSICLLCSTQLSNVPRQSETGYCCYQEWHMEDKPSARIYPKPGTRPPQQPFSHDTSGAPHNEETHTPSPQLPASLPIRQLAPPPTEPSPVVEELWRKRNEEERGKDEQSKSEAEAEAIALAWRINGHRSEVKHLLRQIVSVVPKECTFNVSDAIYNISSTEFRKVYLRVHTYAHPKKVGKYKSTPLEYVVSLRSFPRLQDAFERFKNG